MSTPTHPIIDRLASLPSEQLAVVDAVYVMGHNDRKGIDGLIKSGALEVQKGGTHAPRGKDDLGRPIRHRHVISAAALLVYLVKITSGDKVVILEAIRQRFPHHYDLCARIAKPAAPAETAGNVIKARATKTGAGDSKPEQPAKPKELQLLLFPQSA